MSRAQILLIEDEPDIREVIEYNLTRAGYRVRATGDGGVGLRLAKEERPDLVLLDLMLPGMEGMEVCRRLRARPETSSVPIIMVTARGEENDIVRGLDLGADDYMTKPFSPRELVARVKAIFRRSASEASRTGAGQIARGGLVLDPERHEARVDGRAVRFTATEYRLVHFLAAHPGRVFTRDRILGHVIGEEADVTDRNIDAHVKAARKKLGSRRGLIETVRGIGYRFSEDGG